MSSCEAVSRPPASAKFEVVGFHLDLRVQIMRPKALHALAQRLASLGFNTLVMEWEASFPYERHATISSGAAYSPDEVRAFLAHCRRLGLEVIPLQQTLGHLEYVLRHPRYAHLREAEDDLCQICPRKAEEARTLFRELFADIRVYHDGRYIHLGGDEAYLLGRCPICAAYAGEHGLSRLYADYMRVIVEEAKAAGFVPVLWADMLLKHPECVGLLSRDTILVDWNYGWARDRFGPPERLIEAGFTVWGAAALRSAPDNHSRVEWGRHLENIREFPARALADGYRGMLLTSWSTSGLYGYNRDDGGKVLDLLPIRRVYPLNGHHFLLEAFARSVFAEKPFSPETFLREQATGRFGLPASEAGSFADALLKRDDARLSELHPTRDAEEWEHLVLMESFAEVAAATAQLEARFQSPDFTRDDRPALHEAATKLAARSAQLETRYAEAQRGYLAAGEAAADTAYRQSALLDLLARTRGGV